MPRREDIESILVIGSGPIVIGQACEFDYSGTQACRVLRAEGYRVILANSNPATIMTDPELADRTYIEPLDPAVLAAIVLRERPDAVLPTMGGQTALNLAVALAEGGVLESAGSELIGAKVEAIRTAEDRELFKAAMTEIGLKVADSGFAHSLEEALEVAITIGFPLIVRPSFILGGKGTGIAHDRTTFERLAGEGLAASPVHQILVERSIAGWKEFELEVMRDRADNCVVVCSIENVDPMGVHTGDSITVAPAQTLSDVEYQQMRDSAFSCIRRVGVETGGSNIQFAVDPRGGEQLVIEMNPRVSRSSALASKATGFPIAKIAARLAVGYTLDEIPNDITKKTPACFEPTIDYVVTKVPRWAFEKLPGIPDRLGTRMQSVGEVMAIGRTFPESLQKAMRGLEHGRFGLELRPGRGRLRRAVQRRAARCGLGADARARLPGGGGDPPRREHRRGGRAHGHRPVVPRPDRPRLGAARPARRPCRRPRRSRPGNRRPGNRRPGSRQPGSRRPGSRRPGSRRRRGRSGRGGRPARRAGPRRVAPAEASRLLRRPGGLAPRGDRGRGARGAPSCRGAPDLQDGGHLRRGVRRRDAVLLLHLRGRGRGAAGEPATRASSSARGPTASARGSSSTTAACTPRRRCVPPGSRR